MGATHFRVAAGRGLATPLGSVWDPHIVAIGPGNDSSVDQAHASPPTHWHSKQQHKMSGLLLACPSACSSSMNTVPLRSSAPAARRAALLPLPCGQQRRLAPGSSSLSSSSSSGLRRHHRRQQRLAGGPSAAADADAAASLAAEAAAIGAQQHVQQPADAAATASNGAVAAEGDAVPKKGGSLAKRVVFGVILGLSGAAVIITGGAVYGGVACLAAYQCSKVRCWAAGWLAGL